MIFKLASRETSLLWDVAGEQNLRGVIPTPSNFTGLRYYTTIILPTWKHISLPCMPCDQLAVLLMIWSISDCIYFSPPAKSKSHGIDFQMIWTYAY